MNGKTELLAPAGSFDIFRAVISAGADAVYAGPKRFSARAYADNFTDEEILRAMDEAHVHGRSFYLAVNTLIKNSEMHDALRMVERYYKAGLDAVILQDFGLAREIAREFPGLERHASTQMTVTGPYGIKLLEENGFTQAVLPRELSLDEIREISSQTTLKTECFVHGALCYCYSGKCLMSSMIGGRSANRGKCAQPCRLPYRVVCPDDAADGTRRAQSAGNGGRGKNGPYKDSGKAVGRNAGKKNTGSHGNEMYPLSLKDLCAAPSIRDLIRAGVSSFKIEGRMKGIEYAAGVTEIYRRLIDEADEDVRSDPHTENHLRDLGSRSGFTNGYLVPGRGGRMVSMEAPSHHRETESMTVRQVREKYMQPPEKIPVRLKACIRQGEPARLTMSAGGHAVTVTTDVVQAAGERPLDEGTVREKMTKLGGTPFTAASCEIDLQQGSFVPVSQLKRLRQQAAEALMKSFRPVRDTESADGHRPAVPESADADRYTASAPGEQPAGDPAGGIRYRDPDRGRKDTEGYSGTDRRQQAAGRPVLYVSVVDPAQLQAVLHEPLADAIIIDCDAFPPGDALEEAAGKIHAAQKRCIYAMPHTFRPRTAERWRAWAAENRQKDLPDGYEIRCIDEADFFRNTDLFSCRPFLIAGAGTYAWNRSAAAFFRECGMDLLTVPHELHKSEVTGSGSVLTVYGNTPLMVSAQCVLKNTTGCRDGTGERIMLHDRKGKSFPVRTLCSSCENVIYNCVPTVLFAEGEQISKLGFSGYRMDFLTETPARIREIFRQYRIFSKGENVQVRELPFTYGAWKRGTQ